MTPHRTDALKCNLQKLKAELHATGANNIELHQQTVEKSNFSFSGVDGRIYIQPRAGGYDISLSGHSLQKRMQRFMEKLCSRKPDGYKQTKPEPRQPFWRVKDFPLVKKSVQYYAKGKGIKQRKYKPEKLIKMFQLAAALRKEMLDVGFTDNGGAIHSAERILNILGLCLCYPELSHINNLKNYPGALFSKKALAAHNKGQSVRIEHVNPHRALTRLAIQEIESGAGNKKFECFVKDNFQLVLLTEEEMDRLDKHNRTRIEKNRLTNAEIILADS